MQHGYADFIPTTTTVATTHHITQIFTGMTTIHTVMEPVSIWVTTGGIQAMADTQWDGVIHTTEDILTGIVHTTDTVTDILTDMVVTGEVTTMVTGMDFTPEQDTITTVTIITHTTTDTEILT
jgi:hypothetical protein